MRNCNLGYEIEVMISILLAKMGIGLFTENVLTCHNRESTGVNNKYGLIPFTCFGFGVLVLYMLVRCHTLLGHWTRTQPSLMLLVIRCVYYLLYIYFTHLFNDETQSSFSLFCLLCVSSKNPSILHSGYSDSRMREW